MAKVKKMAFGGLGSPMRSFGGLGSPMRSVKNAVASIPAPMRQPAPAPQLKFMGDKLRGASMAPTPSPAFVQKFGAPGQIAKGAPLIMGAMMKKGGKVHTASQRADGIAQRGKTKGRIV